MVIVGLTGGIATGKSTVAAMFSEQGAVIVDADVIARDVVQKGTPAWEKIRAEFGDEILLDSREIDRDKLGDIIFNDTAKKKLLNRIVHPAVFENVGYDTSRYTGFAFGMGVERIAMLKYGIDDIRRYFDNDYRFLRQF